MSVRSTSALVALTMILAVMPKVVVSGEDASYAIRFFSADGGSLPDDFEFDPQAPTFFVVPGFRDTGLSAASLRQSRAIQQRFPRANVIVVDWYSTQQSQEQTQEKKICFSVAAFRKFIREYRDAVQAAKAIGRDIAQCIKQNGISPHRTVISGHSLGAQIAAFASNECARPEMCCEPVHTIIAADPAGPLFELCEPAFRLDPTDAQHVLVVHTTEVFGDEHAVGTSDVYLDWPEAAQRNDVILHSLSRELVTLAFQNAGATIEDRTEASDGAVDFELAPQLRLPSAGSSAVSQCLRDIEFDLETVLCELVFEDLTY